MSIPQTLLALSHQVRTRTLSLLERTAPQHLLWTPTGTNNHITWHAGHALWVQDVLILQPLTKSSHLPKEWPTQFGMNSLPGTNQLPWPIQKELLEKLTTQLHQINQALTSASPALFENTTPRSLTWNILHALHDESIHQGEIHLLQKLARAHHPL
jgi:hypothetical protein